MKPRQRKKRNTYFSLNRGPHGLFAFYFTFFFLNLMLNNVNAETEKTSLNAPELTNCSWYRAKRLNVPVFSQPDLAAEIKGRLSRGELVCYIGEEKGFAILDWDKQKILRADKRGAYQGTGYARLTELWEPKDRNQSPAEHTRETYRTMEMGGIPEDPLWLLRPFLGVFLSPDPCADKTRIGCKEMEEQNRK